MSLMPVWRPATSMGFPRVSGDEPCVSATDAIPAAFSPRERG